MDVHDLTIPAETIERFWAKVDQSGGPDACWPFVGGSRTEWGYGRFSVSRSKWERAHRFAYRLTHGVIDAPVVMHLCDNPPCCNPAHLRAATVQDNNRDCRAKGRLAVGDRSARLSRPDSYGPRQVRGARHPNTDLSEADVVTIRQSYATGEVSQAELAAAFSLSRSNVSSIVTGASWRETGGPRTVGGHGRAGNRGRKALALDTALAALAGEDAP